MGNSFRRREAQRRTRELVHEYRDRTGDVRDPYTLEDGDMEAHTMTGVMSALLAGMVVLVIGTVVAVAIGAVL